MKILEGTPSPLGFSMQENRANFALFSHHAAQVFLGIFSQGKREEFPMQRSDDVWHVAIEGLPEDAEYAFRCVGAEAHSIALPYVADRWLIDPYAKVPKTREQWGKREKIEPRAYAAIPPPFDWQGVAPPKIPLQDLILYEMHVRGFTQHPSSGVSHPGTFLGVVEKIPYLKELGVNAVELMPLFEFDETHCKGAFLNYWGYSSLHFFAPMRRYASAPKEKFGPIQEFKIMVRELHRNGIEVILDVVYNHTGEDPNTVVHFRGIDKPVYYMLDKHGKSKNYTGCGNTVNVNHPVVQAFILDSLHYWVQEMGVDGFRFDLASIFTRGEHGEVLDPPPILQAIEKDPVLRNCKLIAEAWDAAGLYQVGAFPKWGPWSEWNGRYRDIARRFIKGTDGKAGLFSSALCGTEFLYGYSKTPLSSINFITAHDGFTLRDLVSYQQKHNLANGEENRDGNNQNDSWNCGAEGPTDKPEILALRERQMKNFLLALFLSQGIPMLLMSDEYGHTRHGNNNPYVQDNELNWFLWDELKKNQKMFAFVANLISFRQQHPNLRSPRYLTPNDVDWHGEQPLQPNWNPDCRFVAFSLKDGSPLYVAFNASFNPVTITLPPPGPWKEIVRTDKAWEEHFFSRLEEAPLLPEQVELPPHTALLAKL